MKAIMGSKINYARHEKHLLRLTCECLNKSSVIAGPGPTLHIHKGA